MTAASPLSNAVGQIRRNLITVLSSTILAGLIALATLAINTRALSVGDIGILAAVQAYAILISGIFTLSTHLPLMRMGTIAIEAGDEQLLHQLVHYALRLDIAAGAAAAIVVALCAGPLGHMLGLEENIREGMAIYALPTLFGTLSSANGILRLVDRFDLLRTVEVGCAALLLAAALILGVLDRPRNWYVVAYATVFALSWLGRYVAARIALHARYPRVGSCPPLTWESRREFRSFAISGSLAATIETVRNNADVIAASALFGKEAVGIYGVAKQAAGAIRKFSSFTSLVSFVEFNRLVARGEHEESRKLFRHVLKVCAFLALAATTGTLLLGKPALGYGFGNTYAAGYWILVLLVAAASIQFLMNPVSMYVQILRGGWAQMLCNLVAFGFYAALLIPFASLLGVNGIAVAVFVYFLVATVAGVWVIRTTPVPA